MRKLLYACIATTLLAIAFCAVLLTVHASNLLDSWATIPNRIASLQAAVELLPKQAIPLVTAPVLEEVGKQANALRKELHGDVRLVNRQVSDISGQLNQRAQDALSRVDTALNTVNARTGEALATVAGIRSDLKPTLTNSAALVKDLQDSWDDSYDDANNLLQSSEVAVTQAAQTMQTINKAAPETLKAEQKTATAVAGITTDVHTLTTAATKPKSFLGKAWAAITVFSRLAPLL